MPYPIDELTTMDIILDGDGSLQDVGVLKAGRLKKVLRLERGMSGGRSSVALLVKTEDGDHVLAETSMRLFLTAAAAFIGAEQRMESGAPPPGPDVLDDVTIEFNSDNSVTIRCADCGKKWKEGS